MLNRSVARCGSVALGLLVTAALMASLADHRSAVPAAAGTPSAASPLVFERNDGQHPSDVRFMARGAGYRITMRNDWAALVLSTAAGPAGLAMTFEGARPGVQPRGERPAAARVNYFVGRDPSSWHPDVPTFERIRYPRLYDGVDVVFYGTGQQVEYDVIVAAGARPDAARLRFGGARSMRVTEDGALAIDVANAELRYTKPQAYQLKNGVRTAIDVAYRLDGDAVTFAAGDYDRSSELVIDPVLVFSTYLGGSGSEEVFGVAVDAAGATYVTGGTDSDDFPVSAGSPARHSGAPDAFISKFNRDGALVYSTYFGGSDLDFGLGIAVDAAGAAYATGVTASLDLPVSTGAFQREKGAARDAFVAKLNPAGNRIAYATYLGGSGEDDSNFRAGITTDPLGIATVVGMTASSDFPTTSGALMRTHPDGLPIGFATRLNATGTGLIYSTLLTGATDQRAYAVVLDAQGRAVVAGDVDGAMTTTQTFGGGRLDGYVLKLNTNGSGLVFSTRFGGSGQDRANALTYDPNRDVFYVAGTTSSSDFLPTGLQGRKGDSDTFLFTVQSNGGRGPYSTLLGGSETDEAAGIGSSGDAITLFGTTTSSDFPVAAPQQPFGGPIHGADAFITRLRGSANIIFSTTIGGSSNDTALSGVIDGAGAATIGGGTGSTNFPTAHAAQPALHPSVDDGFVTRTAVVPRGTPGPHDVVVRVAAAATLHGDWEKVSDATAAGGARLHNPDRGRSKVETPLASPADYFEFTVRGLDGGPYRLWLRGRADGDAFTNDSVWVQFERAQNTGSDADDEHDIFRIGTTEAMAVVVEDCTNCGLRGWGWQDGAYGQKLLGPPLYFNNDTPVTVRVQRREDGISIDQIVIAKDNGGEGPYFGAAPGYQKDDDTILPAQDPLAGGDVVRRASDGTPHGTWKLEADPTAAGGVKARNPDAGAPKLTTPLANPVNYFETDVRVHAGVGYRLWIRGRADADSFSNDSAYVQFEGAVDSSGNPIWQVGTTSATTYVLEDCNGCGVQGWGWNDNGYGTGVLGPLVYFDGTGTHRIVIQTREDGLAIDQIVLSPERYLTAAPGRTKNDTTVVPR